MCYNIPSNCISQLMSSCCNKPEPPQETMSSPCCNTSAGKKVDWLLWGSLSLVVTFYCLHVVLKLTGHHWFHHLTASTYELVNTMFIGVIIGIIMIGILGKIPREFVMAILGNGGTKGIFRATLAGVLLDLCSHGILMVGAKLYQRGASIGQVMAFIIASPWNSLSLTIILVALIGLGWTLLFIILSMIIALITGIIFDHLVERNILPGNPATLDLSEDFAFWEEARQRLNAIDFNSRLITGMLISGIKDSGMVIRWLLFGIVLASLLRAFLPTESFQEYFGPTVLGLSLTILMATILEVCSEGSTPIAADIVTRAQAPGNGFAFLMGGVSTDYTEIMILKDTTKSWKIALFLPLISLPQIIVISLLINTM